MKFKSIVLQTEQLKKLAFAHRGLHDLDQGVPENSLEAFENACGHGFGIELDVRLSRDGTAYVFHDSTAERTCGEKVRIRDLCDRDISDLRLFGTDSHIPTFAEVLELISGRVPLLIELKSDGKAVKLAGAVHRALDGYRGAHLIQSFDPRLLRAYARRCPSEMLGLLATRLRENGEKINRLLDFGLRNLMTDFICRVDFISYEFSKRSRLSAFAERRISRGPEFAWTIRTPEDFAAARKRGAVPIFEGFVPRE